DGIRDLIVTEVQTCALPIWNPLRASAYSTSVTVTVSVAAEIDSVPGKLSPPPLSGRDFTPKRTGGATTSGNLLAASIAIPTGSKIGRASCRERVWITEVDGW